MVMILTSVAIVMFGFGFAMVPLYSLFCQVVGLQAIGSIIHLRHKHHCNTLRRPPRQAVVGSR